MTARNVSERASSAFDWEQRALGDPDVSDVVMGQSPPSETYNTARLGLPFFQGKMDFGLRHPTPRLWCTRPAKVAQKDDILISVRAPVGDVNIARETCCIGRGLAAVRAGRLADPEFLFFLMMHHKPDLDGLGSGAIFKAINRDTLRSFEVSLPSLREQRTIANALSKLQTRVELQGCIVVALEELKTATMARLFREGLRGEPLTQTEIGEIPESWRVERLETVAKVLGGKRLPKGEPFAEGRTPFPYVRVVDLKGHSVDTAGLRYLTPEVQAAIKRYVIRSADVYISIAGTTGLVGAIPAELDGANLTENAAKLVLRTKQIDRHFLLWFLAGAMGQAQISALTMKTSQPKLALARIQSIQIPIAPDQEEQREIGEAISRIQLSVAIATRTRDRLRELFAVMLHTLVTGQIRLAIAQ